MAGDPIAAVVWYVAFVFSTTLHEASHALAAQPMNDRDQCNRIAAGEVQVRACNYWVLRNETRLIEVRGAAVDLERLRSGWNLQ